MQTLAGLLCWYSAALPLGRAFVYTLFQCRETIVPGFVRVHPMVQRDLSLWRALIRVALIEPSVMGCPLDLLRSDRLPDYYTVTDACTAVGGGAWVATAPQWTPGNDHYWLTLRWTPAEHVLIRNRLLPFVKQDMTDDLDTVYVAYDHYKVGGSHALPECAGPLTINILEFATVVFLIVVYAPALRGKVLSIGSDNTATLCWLVRNRASCEAADNLLKFLALTCTIYNIRLVVHHVRGIHNQLSDWISRVTGIEDADPHGPLRYVDFASPSVALGGLLKWLSGPDPPDRRTICRVLLSLALTSSDPLTTHDFLRLMLLLRDLPTIPSPLEPRIAVVLDAYQSLEKSIQPPPIPTNIDSAMTAASLWRNQWKAPGYPMSSSTSDK